MPGRCYFCEDLKAAKANDHYEDPFHEIRYKAALIREVAGMDGRIIARDEAKGRRLRFCPYCGRQLYRKRDQSPRKR